MIEINDLSFGYGAADVLRSVSFSAGSGELIALLGSNGVGKSTLFRCMLGLLRPRCGTVTINGRDIRALTRAEAAREIAYIPQSASPGLGCTVLECVLMGTAPKLGILSAPGQSETQLALRTLDELGIAHLAPRSCESISGGERQLALLARALVQNARVLIMDEPTANLDYGNSFRVMRRISELAGRGYTVIFSTHDPNQAFRHASRVLVLKDGSLLADGRPDEALTEERLNEIYGVRVGVHTLDTSDGRFSVSVPYERKD